MHDWESDTEIYLRLALINYPNDDWNCNLLDAKTWPWLLTRWYPVTSATRFPLSSFWLYLLIQARPYRQHISPLKEAEAAPQAIQTALWARPPRPLWAKSLTPAWEDGPWSDPWSDQSPSPHYHPKISAQEGPRPYLQSIQCTHTCDSWRPLHDLTAASSENNRASLSKYSSSPYMKGTHSPLLRASWLWRFPGVIDFPGEKTYPYSLQITLLRAAAPPVLVPVCPSPKSELMLVQSQNCWGRPRCWPLTSSLQPSVCLWSFLLSNWCSRHMKN